MTCSSQDYTITKPGMESQLARQRKPLRTYGRRSASTPEARGEPLAKRRRTSEAEPEAKADTAPVVTQSATTTMQHHDESKATADGGVSVIKKGSILSYFKPIASSSRSATPNVESEILSPSTNTPPSSPPLTYTRRTKRRRLRIRPVHLPSRDASDAYTDDDAQETTEGEEGSAEEDRGKTAMRRPMLEREDELDDRQAVPSVKDPGRGARKRKALSMVQMTLNLSAQAPFSECKVCDTVWNPVIPEDAKYHSRRHAAVLRARKRSTVDDL
ncbi:hypothetical protein HJFPF1_12630 [Paramyrothecium foliicola]|nr:hypothetical protein HJFPF1_12630 [Paramyrothecium foliicola]